MLFDIHKAEVVGYIQTFKNTKLNINLVLDVIATKVLAMKDEAQLQAEFDDKEANHPESWSNLEPIDIDDDI